MRESTLHQIAQWKEAITQEIYVWPLVTVIPLLQIKNLVDSSALTIIRATQKKWKSLTIFALQSASTIRKTNLLQSGAFRMTGIETSLTLLVTTIHLRDASKKERSSLWHMLVSKMVMNVGLMIHLEVLARHQWMTAKSHVVGTMLNSAEVAGEISFTISEIWIEVTRAGKPRTHSNVRKMVKVVLLIVLKMVDMIQQIHATRFALVKRKFQIQMHALFNVLQRSSIWSSTQIRISKDSSITVRPHAMVYLL
jgi:hypothetical protein